MTTTEGQSPESMITTALNLLDKIEESSKQFYTKMYDHFYLTSYYRREETFVVPYTLTQAQIDSKHITTLLAQLEKLLDSLNLTFTLDQNFNTQITNIKDAMQQLKQETTESKNQLNLIARNASSVVEQVQRFDVMQYQHDEEMEQPVTDHSPASPIVNNEQE